MSIYICNELKLLCLNIFTDFLYMCANDRKWSMVTLLNN